MQERFTERVRKILHLAHDEALRFKNNFIGTEHLLLAMIKEGEGVGAQQDQRGHLRRIQPFRGIGAVTHHCAREHARSDIVRKRVRGERAQRDEDPADVLDAKMQKRDAVVPGERGVSEQGGESGEQIVDGRNAIQTRPDFGADRLALKLAVEQINGAGNRDQANHRPEVVP